MNKKIISIVALSMFLVGCDMHSSLNGNVSFKEEEFLGMKELGEFEIFEEGTYEISLPYEMVNFQGYSDLEVMVRYEPRGSGAEFTESEEILTKKVGKGDKGTLSFVSKGVGEYEVYLYAAETTKIDFRINLESVDGGLDLD